MKMMELCRFLYATMLLVTATSTTGYAQPNYNELGRLGYAQWNCAALATFFDADEQVRADLFRRGYDSLYLLVSAMMEGELQDEDTRNVPIGILWNLTGGPSPDFVLGYLWASMKEDAYDSLEVSIDNISIGEAEELWAIESEMAFRDANCELLR